mgnify:CR=1 FL=1
MDTIEDVVEYEWHVVDILDNNAWVWASTKEDAIQRANTLSGLAQVESCERVKDE